MTTGKIEKLIEPVTSISADGKEAVSVTFTANKAWTAKAEKTWCTVTPASGETGGDIILTITAGENGSYDERNSKVTITCGDAVEYVTVTQKQKDAILLTSGKVEVKREGEEFTVKVKANVSFTSEVSEEDRDWLRLVTQTRALSTSVLKFAASENMSDEKREGAITFKSGDLLETVTVYQAGSIPTIVLNETNYKIPAEGQDITIELQSNVEYTIQLPAGVIGLGKSRQLKVCLLIPITLRLMQMMKILPAGRK